MGPELYFMFVSRVSRVIRTHRGRIAFSQVGSLYIHRRPVKTEPFDPVCGGRVFLCFGFLYAVIAEWFAWRLFTVFLSEFTLFPGRPTASGRTPGRPVEEADRAGRAGSRASGWSAAGKASQKGGKADPSRSNGRS
ncbi:hypothetical protein [Streptomyces camelliae]|uniref:Uncharacterized protein n=1 Tax=Streptomyces camelliae TaxID=3004093 RepID=A0ABY7P7B5_9ACTN|nr:hypothetical protein [Streptomyces sp. HUAS 2-6]WBO64736.1 hypothetical protein O1G22_18780 [Streptomyces sp. HUAS 2-6]